MSNTNYLAEKAPLNPPLGGGEHTERAEESNPPSPLIHPVGRGGKRYQGVIVPIVTPLDYNRQIDTEAVGRIICNITKYDSAPLVMGTTGEGTSLTHKQSLTLIRTAKEATPKEIPLYVAANDNCIQRLIEKIQSYALTGADIITATLPAYYPLTDSQIKEFYTTIADNSSIPIFIYNIPITTHTTIPIDTILALAQHPNIHGIKDSDRDVDRMIQLLSLLHVSHPTFQFFCGCTANSSIALEHHADGIVPSIANYLPQVFQKLYLSAISGHTEESRRWQQLAIQAAQITTKGYTLGESLAGLKVIMKQCGLCEEFMLPPLTELSDEKKEEIRHHFSDLALIVNRQLINDEQ